MQSCLNLDCSFEAVVTGVLHLGDRVSNGSSICDCAEVAGLGDHSEGGKGRRRRSALSSTFEGREEEVVKLKKNYSPPETCSVVISTA